MRGEHTYIAEKVRDKTSEEWMEMMFPRHEDRAVPASVVFGVAPSTVRDWIHRDNMGLHSRIIAAIYTGEMMIDELEDIAEGAI